MMTGDLRIIRLTNNYITLLYLHSLAAVAGWLYLPLVLADGFFGL